MQRENLIGQRDHGAWEVREKEESGLALWWCWCGGLGRWPCLHRGQEPGGEAQVKSKEQDV